MLKTMITVLCLCVLTEGCATERLYVHVEDELGRPVSNAVVRLGTMNKYILMGSDKAKDYDHYEAMTDTNGNAVVKFRCLNGCFGWGVSASNYYPSASRRDEFKGEDLVSLHKYRLDEHEKRVSAVIWRKRNPQPMVVWGDKVRRKVPDGIGRFGFDLGEFDWVAPHGRGKAADLYYSRMMGADYSVGDVVGRIDFIGGNGAYVAKKNAYEAFPTTYEADLSATYKTNFVSRGYRKAGHLLRTNFISKDEYMVVRSRVKTDEQGKILSAHYAKIFGPLFVGDNVIVAEEVVFNPVENDPNLEFDVGKNLNEECKGAWLSP